MSVSGIGPGVLGNSFKQQATLFDDFLSGNNSYYADNSTGTGAVTIVSAGNVDADEGLGIVEFDTGAAAGTARWDTALMFRGSFTTSAELRVKLPSTPGDVAFEWGFDDLSGSSCRVGYSEGESDWTFQVESQDGASSDSDPLVEPLAGGWQNVRLEWDPGSAARFYLNDTLISTLSGAGAVPNADDQMALFFSVTRAAGPASQVYMDWVRVIARRT